MQSVMLNNIFLPEYSQIMQLKQIPSCMSDSFFIYFIAAGSVFLIFLLVIKVVIYFKRTGDYNFQFHYSIFDIVLTDDYNTKKIMKLQNIISGLLLFFSALFVIGLFLFR